MKKRILAVALTLLLVISMAVPASAAMYVSNDLTCGDCTYYYSARCGLNDWHCLMEMTIFGDDYASYRFRIDAYAYGLDEFGECVFIERVDTGNCFGVASAAGTKGGTAVTVYKVESFFYVNDAPIRGLLQLMAS